MVLDGRPLSLDAVISVARSAAVVELGAASAQRLDESRRGMLAHAAAGSALYGINTGFGSFSHVRLASDQLALLQANLIRSHSAGVGDPLETETVRAMMVILAASLARGHSGVRPALVESICAHLNHGLSPIVPSRGSVGASGDLAPLAHVAQGLIGEGMMQFKGQVMRASEAQAASGIAPIRLEEKEGLALINGTHLMTALGALAIHDTQNLLHAALAATAMGIDGCRGASSMLDARIHAARNQPGQIAVAAALRELLQNSQIGPAHAQNDPRVQDPYSLRAAPQVLGAVVDAFQFAKRTITNELGAVTDNPLVFGSAKACEVLSGANFHGMPLAISLDLLRVALCHLAGIGERRIYWALSGHDKESKLPAHLSAHPGMRSGLMIVQYTAAALCNELRTLAYPSSVGNISTCAGIEDYNSMGATSALQARDAVRLTRAVVACELLVMAEAIEFQRPLLSGTGVEHAHHRVRTQVMRLGEDRSPSPDIAAISAMILDGLFAPCAATLF
ncbi:MAG: histidine ammonia-lyase [Phycisphaerales bacterium]|nr:histidine ammonia-lyase [Phycisphaerales bacterium]